MKKIIFILFCSLLVFKTYATHIIGYEMSMQNIKNSSGISTDSYKLILKLYTDTIGSGFANTLSFSIKPNNSNPSTSITFTKVSQTILSFPNNLCYPASAQGSVELGVYEATINNPSNYSFSGGYYIFDEICCRQNGVTNIVGVSESLQIIPTMEFPSLNTTSATRYNSSPSFNKLSVSKLTIGNSYTLDWSATDPDGDILIYSIVTPLASTGINSIFQKPFPTVTYSSGFKLDSNIAGGNPDFQINSQTGRISYKPMMAGTFDVTVMVEEYRIINGTPTKLGAIYREMNLTTVFNTEQPPVVKDTKNRTKVIVDTVDYMDEYILDLTATDLVGDSLFLKIIPNQNENLFDSLLYGAKWGSPGNLVTGNSALKLILKGISNLPANFYWKPECKNIRNAPYKVTFVVNDLSCPVKLYDTLEVYIHVKSKPNNKPMFVFPDTITNHKVIKYYVKKGDVFRFSADSSIRVTDPDPTHVVDILAEFDPANGSQFNNTIVFSSNPAINEATAQLSVVMPCGKSEPYRIKFYAFDNACVNPDTASFTIELYVLPNEIAKPNICGVVVDSFFNKNYIYWKNNDVNASGYIIYKENKITQQYDSIGFVNRINENGFADENSSPDIQSENYKIVAEDECGTKSLLSETFNSILLETQRISDEVVNLSWTNIAGSVKDSFIVWRANTNPVFKKIKTLPITQTNFSDTAFFTWEVKHRIEFKRDSSCLSYNGIPLKNYSNIRTDLFGGLGDKKINDFKIHPNPASDEIVISGLNIDETLDLCIYDLHGKKIFQQDFIKYTKVNVRDFNSGIYFIRLGNTVQKFVKL